MRARPERPAGGHLRAGLIKIPPMTGGPFMQVLGLTLVLALKKALSRKLKVTLTRGLQPPIQRANSRHVRLPRGIANRLDYPLLSY